METDPCGRGGAEGGAGGVCGRAAREGAVVGPPRVVGGLAHGAHGTLLLVTALI